jgi:glycosyltransferase involved in cell wall biosynthesis
MKTTVTLSIITPSYNQGEFLAETIESVLSQAGDFYLDYIIIDGGSKDNSVEVIKHFEDSLKLGQRPITCRGITYRWLSEQDRGQTDALVKGFRMACGEIFGWLNSDDTYLPGALQAAAAHFKSNPDSALLYGDANYCDAAGSVIGRYRTEPFEYEKLAYFNFICQPSAFFRSEVYLAVGGLDEKLQFALDFDLWVRIARHYPCHYLPQVFALYRLHESSKTVRDDTLFENAEEALQLSLKYFAWAPLTRVYNACNPYCRSRLPACLTRLPGIVLVATIFCSVLRSLRLNRGIRRGDLRLLSWSNFQKLFRNRREIMTGKARR